MINLHDYSNNKVTITMTIGGLNDRLIKQTVETIIAAHGHQLEYSINESASQLKLILATQEIPEFVKLFTNENLAIYEMKEIKEKTTP
ncbi:hypothetical protein G7081_03500 [Vagococcus coleopterorum]|uniref:Uncharacterized protein n=1 Tax=Vagococcus coleopterorum TaxID=2714946 RepID=A0A6G8AMM5_9ENTE|nr:hypothetical protein [Vagococcus coleopterorum]QIL46202.1 hypothetical protein G7081_03500 [Vagococcus coleopterorum]